MPPPLPNRYPPAPAPATYNKFPVPPPAQYNQPPPPPTSYNQYPSPPPSTYNPPSPPATFNLSGTNNQSSPSVDYNQVPSPPPTETNRSSYNQVPSPRPTETNRSIYNQDPSPPAATYNGPSPSNPFNWWSTSESSSPPASPPPTNYNRPSPSTTSNPPRTYNTPTPLVSYKQYLSPPPASYKMSDIGVWRDDTYGGRNPPPATFDGTSDEDSYSYEDYERPPPPPPPPSCPAANGYPKTMAGKTALGGPRCKQLGNKQMPRKCGKNGMWEPKKSCPSRKY